MEVDDEVDEGNGFEWRRGDLEGAVRIGRGGRGRGTLEGAVRVGMGGGKAVKVVREYNHLQDSDALEEESEERVAMPTATVGETPDDLDYNEPPQEEPLEDSEQGVELPLPPPTTVVDEQFVATSAAAMEHDRLAGQGLSAMRAPAGVITQSGIMK